jgi:hypothetical protein
MVTIQVNGVVQPDGTVTLTLPAEVLPGEHVMVVVVETQPTIKAKRARTANGKTSTRLELPLDHAVPRDPNMTFSREEIYGEWGR